MIGSTMIDQLVRREQLMDDLRAIRGSTPPAIDLGRRRVNRRPDLVPVSLLAGATAAMGGIIG